MRRGFGGTVLFLALLTVFSATAPADTVTVTGGFTSFTGPVIGESSGTSSQINGSVVCPDSGCATQIDTATVNFTTPQTSVSFQNFTPLPNTPNLVEFTPAAPQTVPGPGSEFLWGTLTFTNGIWSGNADFGFQLTSVSTDPALNGHVFSAIAHLALTPNSFCDAQNTVCNTPEQNADILEFVDPSTGQFLTLPSVRVYELNDTPDGTNTGTVDLFGEIGSLFPTRFANPTGGLFLDVSHDLTLGGPPGGSTVPEPSYVGLMSLVILAAGLIARRKALPPWVRR